METLNIYSVWEIKEHFPKVYERLYEKYKYTVELDISLFEEAYEKLSHLFDKAYFPSKLEDTYRVIPIKLVDSDGFSNLKNEELYNFLGGEDFRVKICDLQGKYGQFSTLVEWILDVDNNKHSDLTYTELLFETIMNMQKRLNHAKENFYNEESFIYYCSDNNKLFTCKGKEIFFY